MSRNESYIHLSKNRGVSKGEGFLSFISYSDEPKESVEAFRLLYRFGEKIIAPSQNVTIKAPSDCFYLTLPLVGGLDLLSIPGNPIVATGEMFGTTLSKEQELNIQNPFENETVDSLEILLASDFFICPNDFLLENLNSESDFNNLKAILVGSFGEIMIGTFESRREYLISEEKVFHAFVYVICGSFEVNGMLLHEKDSASFFNISSLDFESLSSQSIILVYKEESSQPS
jgi:quercetin 2,3-dioxygenase